MKKFASLAIRSTPITIQTARSLIWIVNGRTSDSMAHMSEGTGWSGGAKMSCILRHRGVRHILAYSRARPPILVAGKRRGGGEGYFFCLFTFIPVPLSSLSLSFISSNISFLRFSGRRHKMTHKGWRVVNLNPKQYLKVHFWRRGSIYFGRLYLLHESTNKQTNEKKKKTNQKKKKKKTQKNKKNNNKKQTNKQTNITMTLLFNVFNFQSSTH